MSSLDTLVGLGGSVPGMLALGAAPAGASAVTDRVFAGQAAGVGADGQNEEPSIIDHMKRVGVSMLPGGGLVSPFMKGGMLEDVPDAIDKAWNGAPIPSGPIDVPVDPSKVPRPAPDPVPVPTPAPPKQQPAPPPPRTPMSGPMPELPWYLEPAGPSTW
jgi:hypothetical protein